MWPNFILRISRPFLLKISVGNSHGRGFGAGIPYFGFKLPSYIGVVEGCIDTDYMMPTGFTLRCSGELYFELLRAFWCGVVTHVSVYYSSIGYMLKIYMY
ncbi:hypothetical protein V6Z11_D05G272300 [Gossypium hirsutum]